MSISPGWSKVGKAIARALLGCMRLANAQPRPSAEARRDAAHGRRIVPYQYFSHCEKRPSGQASVDACIHGLELEDTSASVGFATTDWQLSANDTFSGGANKFFVEDLTSATVPLVIEGGRPNNALYLDSTGRTDRGATRSESVKRFQAERHYSFASNRIVEEATECLAPIE